MRNLILISILFCVAPACKNETTFKDTKGAARGNDPATSGLLPPSFLDQGGVLPPNVSNDNGTLVIPSTNAQNGINFPNLGDLFKDFGSSNTPNTIGSGPIFPTQPPVTAITKGSFTVWTNPTNPRPYQAYNLHVQVQLPSTINLPSYNVRDLSGCVIGTDEYFFILNKGERGRSPASTCADESRYPASQFRMGLFQQIFSSSFGKANLSIRIPGAVRLVKDRITVSSAVLNETQTVDLIFN